MTKANNGDLRALENRVRRLEILEQAHSMVKRCNMCGHVPVDHRMLGQRETCWGNKCPCILTRFEAAVGR